MKHLIFLLLVLLSIPAFAQQSDTNPPAPGFNVAASDAKAIEVADAVMQAMGGRQNWDATRYIAWRFFGVRLLIWDKYTGNVRVESGDMTYLVNINDNTGRVQRAGQEITDPDSLQIYVQQGISIWINDSYWLVMPFKLKDSGVTLRYLGERNTAENQPADVLQLTFEGVGRTPQNKYHVYVDKTSRLVTQWDFFGQYSDEAPRFSNARTNYQPHGNILLSDGRGQRAHTQVGVYDRLPESVFNSFDPVDLSDMK